MRRTWPLFLVSLLAACAGDVGVYAPPRVVAPGDAAPALASPNVAAIDPAGFSMEASIAADPVNPQRLVVSAMKVPQGARSVVRAWYSQDGGASWRESSQIPMTAANGHTYDGSGDPVTVADRAGRFHLNFLVTRGTGPYVYSGLASSTSEDGGATWSPLSLVSEIVWPEGAFTAPFDDKNWLAVDNTGGRYDGNLYAHWQRMTLLLSRQPSDFMFSRSTDHGRTWSEPRAIGPTELGGSSTVEVGADGEVYIGHWGSGFNVQVSHDGGDTFGRPVLVTRSGGGAPQAPPRRAPLFPILVADRSFGPHRGTVYYAHGTQALAPSGNRFTAPAVAKTTDRGATWSPVRAIAPPGEGDALFPTATVNQTTGELVFAWLDRREDPSRRTARVYASRSRDGGATFDAPRAFSGPISVDADFIGDYYTVAAAGNHYVATFTDAAGRLSAFTIRFDSTDPQQPRRRGVRR